MIEENNNETEPKEESSYYDIYPIKRTKRVLLFLADFFIVFILGIFLCNVAVYPLARVITDERSNEDTVLEYRRSQYDVLYGNKILFYEEKTQYSYTDNLQTTFDKYARHYILQNDDGEADIFATYYIGIRNKTYGELNDIYRSYKEMNVSNIEYFLYQENGLPELKEEYVVEFQPIFDELNEPSETTKKDYSHFQNYFFSNIYGNMMTDVVELDLTFGTDSYNDLGQKIVESTDRSDLTVAISAAVSYFVAVSLMLLLIPLVTRRGKTPGSFFIKLERVTKNNLKLCSAKEKIIYYFYMLVMCLPALMFMPWPTLAFAELFSLGTLFFVSVAGLVLDIASLIVLIVSKYNQTITDISSLTINISSENLDQVYRLKGYEF